jgi:hypothetical protein
MRYSCLFSHRSGATKSVIIALEAVEIRSIEALRKLRGAAEADIVAQAYALRHAYREVSRGFKHSEPPTAVRAS